eukprot:TRINITY_DN120823_c0_g1_i1.p1 TRINITY_DN120823_c0_g1~~TRINITY_DN120823_c0_g1_i1.p1  ORF type:complete len:687 (+),score=193.64 TRINITY_DN120823_c0_g1_i1:106-2166(+)
MARDADLFRKFEEIRQRRGDARSEDLLRAGVQQRAAVAGGGGGGLVSRSVCFVEAHADGLKAIASEDAFTPAVSSTARPQVADSGSSPTGAEAGKFRPPPLPALRLSSHGHGYPPSTEQHPAATELQDWLGLRQALDGEAGTLERECRQEATRPRAAAESAYSGPLAADWEESLGDGERWQEALWGDLGRLRKRIRALGQNARCARPGQLQVVARGVERELEGFKSRQRQEYEALASEEASLSDFLTSAARRMEAWAAEPSALSLKRGDKNASAAALAAGQSEEPGSVAAESPGKPGTKRNGSRKRPSSGSTKRSTAAAAAKEAAAASIAEDAKLEEISARLADLDAEEKQSGGATGGWSCGNHDIFCRIFRMFKHQATAQCYARLQERLPEVPVAKLEEHVVWWSQNEARQAERRALVLQWRSRRNELEREVAAKEEEQQSAELEQKRQAEKQRQMQNAEQKRLVSEWKRQRAEEEERAASLHRVSEQEQAGKQRRAEQERQKQQQAQKEAVEAFRRQQREEAAARAAALEAAAGASRRAMSQEDQARMNRRNLEMLKRRLQASEHAQAAAAAAEAAARSRTRAYEHVESRLYNSTECFIQKVVAGNPVSAAHEAPPARPPAPPPQGAPGHQPLPRGRSVHHGGDAASAVPFTTPILLANAATAQRFPPGRVRPSSAPPRRRPAH